jgi:glycosyltransferase involved in cell wall biosynthesis
MEMKKISAIIIAKNEEEKIGECLESVSWVDEIVVVDNGSDDNTIQISEEHNAVVLNKPTGTYKDLRNFGLEKAKGKWILYIDADERVTPLLVSEIQKLLAGSQEHNAYAIPRRNIVLNKEMKHGGLWPDYVKRLFLKEKLSKWKGDLHEEPIFEGDLGHLKSPFVHIKHDNLYDMVEKTNKWSLVEAKMLLDANHPKMSWWRFIRVILTEAWYRLIRLGGYKDGVEGFIYSIYQSWSKFITYAKLWELQRKTN